MIRRHVSWYILCTGLEWRFGKTGAVIVIGKCRALCFSCLHGLERLLEMAASVFETQPKFQP
jgi:hypothetical protein